MHRYDISIWTTWLSILMKYGINKSTLFCVLHMIMTVYVHKICKFYCLYIIIWSAWYIWKQYWIFALQWIHTGMFGLLSNGVVSDESMINHVKIISGLLPDCLFSSENESESKLTRSLFGWYSTENLLSSPLGLLSIIWQTIDNIKMR